jgi:large subunit ribosomal protein L9
MATKLLLIEDVENLGRSGDIVSAREGYVRNFLLPQKKAVIADQNALRKQKALKEARLQQAIVDKKDAEELAKTLSNLSIHTEVKVDPEGHMYGSVSHLDVVELLKAQHGIELDKRFVLLKQPIRATGAFVIDLKLKEGVPATISLRITPEGGDFEAAIEASKHEEVSVIGELPAEEDE